MRALFCTVILLGASACGLGDGDISEEGEPCRSDLDCPASMECVPAESPNASAVCMPLP